MAVSLRALNVWLARRELHRRRADFYYDLGATLHDRVPLVTTLRKYEMRARLRRPSTAPMYMQMLKGLQSGSLSHALEGVSSPMEQTLIDATQSAGDSAMAEGLIFMSTTVEKTDKMVASIRKAMVYPIGLLAMFGAMLAGFSLTAVPVLTELLPPDRWPPSGRALYVVSQIIAQHGFAILGVLVAAFLLFLYSLPRWRGPWRARVDRFLPYSLYRDFSGSLLLISLASMMRSGVSLRSALERSLTFSSPWLRWHIRKVLSNLSKPNVPHFGQAFATGLLSQQLEDRVQDASERRDPIDAFVRMGVSAVDRMGVYIDQRAAALNKLMLAVCGLMLGLMMVGFFSTTMSLQSSIKEGAGAQVSR
jgi:type II secretory pathway component PulF